MCCNHPVVCHMLLLDTFSAKAITCARTDKHNTHTLLSQLGGRRISVRLRGQCGQQQQPAVMTPTHKHACPHSQTHSPPLISQLGGRRISVRLRGQRGQQQPAVMTPTTSTVPINGLSIPSTTTPITSNTPAVSTPPSYPAYDPYNPYHQQQQHSAATAAAYSAYGLPPPGVGEAVPLQPEDLPPGACLCSL